MSEKSVRRSLAWNWSSSAWNFLIFNLPALCDLHWNGSWISIFICEHLTYTWHFLWNKKFISGTLGRNLIFSQWLSRDFFGRSDSDNQFDTPSMSNYVTSLRLAYELFYRSISKKCQAGLRNLAKTPKKEKIFNFRTSNKTVRNDLF